MTEEKKERKKALTWLKIGIILLLPSPVIGVVIATWSVYKLATRNAKKDKENEPKE